MQNRPSEDCEPFAHAMAAMQTWRFSRALESVSQRHVKNLVDEEMNHVRFCKHWIGAELADRQYVSRQSVAHVICNVGCAVGRSRIEASSNRRSRVSRHQISLTASWETNSPRQLDKKVHHGYARMVCWIYVCFRSDQPVSISVLDERFTIGRSRFRPRRSSAHIRHRPERLLSTSRGGVAA